MLILNMQLPWVIEGAAGQKHVIASRASSIFDASLDIRQNGDSAS
jgi:hypothetical protein